MMPEIKDERQKESRYAIIAAEATAALMPNAKSHELAVAVADILLTRYEQTDEFSLLEAAVDKLAEEIESTEDSEDEYCAGLAYMYSKCLRVRFMRGQDEKEIDNAICFADDAVIRTQRIDVENKSTLLAQRKNQHALSLFTKAHQVDGSAPEILDKAIAIVEEVFATLQQDHADEETQIETMNNLGMFLQVRYDQKGSVDDLRRAVQIGYTVLGYLPPDSSYAMEGLSNLAFRMQRAYKEFVSRNLLSLEDDALPRPEQWEEEAVDLICRSMEIPCTRELAKLEQGLTFVMYTKELAPETQSSMLLRCSTFLQKLVSSLPGVLLTLGSFDQQDVVSTFYGISRYAAAALLEEGKSFEALQVLETGRGIVVSLGLDSLDVSQCESSDEGRPTLPLEINSISRETRTSPSFSDLEKVLDEAQTKNLAKYGPLIIINITDLRSDAIIVTTEGIKHLHLPDLNEDKVSEQSWDIQQLLAKTNKTEQREDFPKLHRLLSRFMNSLWKSTVKPILDHLGYRKPLSLEDEWPHVWWIPTGILGLYPIHAAGPGLHLNDDTMKRVISSYAPTLKALYRSRLLWQKMSAGVTEHLASKSAQSRKAAAVVMAHTPSRPPLDLGPNEAHSLKEAFPEAEILNNPKKAEVLALLRGGVSVVHFTCHGETDYDEPSKSMLLLDDWETDPFTVGDIRHLDIKEAQLAVLSACFTANAGVENLQDEVSHLVSSIQIAGFCSVIGSYWYVGERDALEVTKGFYELLAADKSKLSPKKVVRALHFAVLRFRESTKSVGNRGKGNPIAWAPFVIFGG
jgi:hypothetical protein